MVTVRSYKPGKYGRAALLAVKLYHSGKATSPEDAWRQAVDVVFPASPSCREKGCPKGAFLGLCHGGLIPGILASADMTAQVNRQYAINAVGLLRENPALVNDKNLLWVKVTADEDKRHNSQMDVVLSLWAAGDIPHDQPTPA